MHAKASKERKEEKKNALVQENEKLKKELITLGKY